MSVYIAVKYRNNMSIFDHYDDGLVRDKASKDKGCEIASLKSRKLNGEVDLSEVRQGIENLSHKTSQVH